MDTHYQSNGMSFFLSVCLAFSTVAYSGTVRITGNVTVEQGDTYPFFILSEELNLAKTPVCAVTTSSSFIQEGPSLNRRTTRHNTEGVMLDDSGAFKIKMYSSDDWNVDLFVNGGESQTENCDDSEKFRLNDALAGANYRLWQSEVANAMALKYDLKVDIKLQLSPSMLNEKKKFRTFIESIWKESPHITDLIARVDAFLLAESLFVRQYPKSALAIRRRILENEQMNFQLKTDELYKSGQFDECLKRYSDLLKLFPESRFASANKERLSYCLSWQQQKASFDSLMSVVASMTDRPRAIKTLEHSLTQMSDSNLFKSQLQSKIDGLYSAIEADKRAKEEQREAEALNKLLAKDKAALKRYHVDLSVNQMDIFANPFAFQGSYVALSCYVEKFETRTSAIMQGAKQFFADFSIQPPKKLMGLNIIARVKGTKRLVNAYGTPINVPHLEIVYLLQESPSYYQDD